MTTQTRQQWICPQHSSSPHVRIPLQWPDSIVVNLLIAGAIGFLYIFLVVWPSSG